MFRQYFLSHNDEIRRNIRSILPGIIVKYLSLIETGFLRGTNIENIATEIEANHLMSDLKSLQIEYYTSLAQISVQGKTNSELEKLLANNNELFKKVLSAKLDEQIFEKEMTYAIRLTERSAFKKKFGAIDLEEEFQLQESEIKSAITQVERESIRQGFENIDDAVGIEQKPAPSVISFKRIAKYAAAAAIIGIVFFGGYLIINNKGHKNEGLVNKESKKDSLKKYMVANLPVIAEHQSTMQLLVPESFGFVKEGSTSLTIVIQKIGKQIDTLKKIYSNEIEGKNIADYGATAKKISEQLDSLLMIANTYSFDIANKKIIVRLLDEQKVDKVISTNPSQKSNLFIKINKDYYQLKSTTLPQKLMPVGDKSTIEELDKIIFQNSQNKY